MSNILVAENVSKSFGKTNVLKNFSIDILNGEIHTLLGANGAGKTTFVKIIATLLSKDKGSVQIRGYDIEKDKNIVKKLIGYVGQDTERSAYGRLTAKDNLLYFGQLHGLSKKQVENQISKYSDYFGAEELLGKQFMKLSGGQKQTIVIIRAFLHDPILLILDEPTKGLDPVVANKMRQLLKTTVTESGKTILLTSHILSEVEFLSDRVSLINEGNVILQGKPEELISRLNADTYFEIDVDYTHEEIIKKLDECFVRKAYSNKKIITYPLHNLYDDSSKIFKLLKDSNRQVKFNYKQPSLEDVFLENIENFDEKFEG